MMVSLSQAASMPQANRRCAVVSLQWAVCLIAMLSCGITARAAQNETADLEVLSTRWGFAGTVPIPSFSILNVKVRNHSHEPWKGTFRVGPASGDDAVTAISATLPPLSVEWVQLLPYVTVPEGQWKLTWGELPAHSAVVTGPTQGHVPLIQLTPQLEPITPGGAFPRYPAELFPRSIAPFKASSPMILVLDFAPEWEAAQSQSFLDWLGSGGLLLLSQTPEQKFPLFQNELHVLNGTAERSIWGSGSLLRIPLQSADDRWRSMISKIANDYFRSRDITAEQGSFRHEREFQYPVPLGDRPILDQLQERVRFNRNWLLVNLSVIAYLLVLFPLCYRIGHVKKNVRAFYLIFAGSICLFSVVFWMIGQLGASEQNRIASAAVAESVGRQRLIVSQWSQLAAVKQLDATLSHAGEGVWYGTGSAFDRSRGVLFGGNHAHADLKFPPASTRTLLHRETLTNLRPSPVITAINLDESALRDVQFSIAGCFEFPPRMAYAVRRGLGYPLELKGDVLSLKKMSPPVSVVDFLIESSWFQPRNRLIATGKSKAVEAPIADLDLFRLLLASKLGVTDANRGRISMADQDDQFTLAVLTEMPKDFFANSKDFHRQSGVVLWTYQISAPR